MVPISVRSWESFKCTIPKSRLIAILMVESHVAGLPAARGCITTMASALALRRMLVCVANAQQMRAADQQLGASEIHHLINAGSVVGFHGSLRSHPLLYSAPIDEPLERISIPLVSHWFRFVLVMTMSAD